MTTFTPTDAAATGADPEDAGLPFVSVIIPTWNRAGFLDGCVRSVTSQDYPAERFEVIVADDGSDDATEAVVRASSIVSSARVWHLRLSHRGTAAARNAGARAAMGELLTFIDDDEMMPPGYLRRVVGALAAGPSLSGVGGPCREVTDGTPRTCDRCSLGAVDPPSGSDGTAEALVGGNMTVRREAFERVGGFDEDLIGRGEDTEWFARAHGLRFGYDRDLWISHRRGARGRRALCATAFRQGLGLPLYQAKTGAKVRANPTRVVRFAAHAVRRGCWNGVIRASREAGVCVGFVRFKVAPPKAGRS